MCAGRPACARGGRGRGRTARRACVGDTASTGDLVPPGVVGRGAASRPAITSCRNWPRSSVTPRKREPPPSSPAASAPCSESGALSSVTRAAIAVGVKPWSASATSTASNSTAPAVGSRLRHQPVRQLAERDLADQVVGQVVAEQPDVSRVGGAERGPVRSGCWSAWSGPAAASSAGLRRRRSPARPDLVGVLAELAVAARCSGPASRKRDRVADRGRRRARRRRVTTGSRPSRSASSTPSAIELIGPHGTPTLFSCSNHSRADQVASRLDQQRMELGPVAVAIGVGANRASSASSGASEHLAQRAELAVVAGRDDHVAVPGRHRLVRVDARVRVAHPVRHHAAGHVGAGLVHQPRHRRRQQVHLDVLALAGRGRGGAARPASPIVRCRPVITSNTEMPARYGGPSGIPGQAHQPGHRLDDQVVAGQPAPAAVPNPLIEQ